MLYEFLNIIDLFLFFHVDLQFSRHLSLVPTPVALLVFRVVDLDQGAHVVELAAVGLTVRVLYDELETRGGEAGRLDQEGALRVGTGGIPCVERHAVVRGDGLDAQVADRLAGGVEHAPPELISRPRRSILVWCLADSVAREPQQA